MSVIRVTKEFDFEMAHALWNYDGPCRNVHGHSYKLFVTLRGEALQDDSDPKNGMVIDFGDLKSIVKREIVDRFDHSVVVSGKAAKDKLRALDQMFGNMIIVDYQPTCENLVEDIALRIKPFFNDKLELFSVKLYETATSFAEWVAGDNL